MIYAIPYQNGNIAPHFARASEIAIVDQTMQLLDCISVPSNPSQCSSKTFWHSTIKQQQASAVIVNSIGTKMLDGLFNQNIQVFAAPRKQSLTELTKAMLKPVLDMSYAKQPRKKSGGCCAGHKKSEQKINKLSQIKPAAFQSFKVIKS